jgi:hypothetical protein
VVLFDDLVTSQLYDVLRHRSPMSCQITIAAPTVCGFRT